jgi:hypothetical protein
MLWQVNPPRLPDWEHDLNAMHELETGLTKTLRPHYSQALAYIIPYDQQDLRWWDFLHATAAQRAEAWLAVMEE